ncbi:MAG: hydroxymethylpyrimidine/phosphomethylpyrimidine kinase [Betaproteobacteria bacterium RIFCSPLOWO2_02_FULL_66_14]|nr:MAG: hydroxymethylpyrimidine/phosphomethylpyrimidine kinase [Betaproteobacteria bacterium RIFCSPLOWO2_02_FULL_66_14]
MPNSPPIVVVFAASDPTCGAGLQADLLTLAAHGCHAGTVVTALTVQDTHGVRRLEPVEASWVEQQGRAILDEMPVAAFKLGVLASAQNVASIARLLALHPEAPVVLDPVLASGRGEPLGGDAVLEAMRAELLPRTMVLTPNSLEARRLAGHAPDADLAVCARRLLQLGARYVLVTGTHEASTDVVNTLYGAQGALRTDRWPRLAASYHGSGCTLASAIAAQLALGRALPEAVHAAQEYTWKSLEAGFRPGSGQWIPDRLHALRRRAP